VVRPTDYRLTQPLEQPLLVVTDAAAPHGLSAASARTIQMSQLDREFRGVWPSKALIRGGAHARLLWAKTQARGLGLRRAWAERSSSRHSLCPPNRPR
jgi:hypothetical protein